MKSICAYLRKFARNELNREYSKFVGCKIKISLFLLPITLESVENLTSYLLPSYLSIHIRTFSGILHYRTTIFFLLTQIIWKWWLFASNYIHLKDPIQNFLENVSVSVQKSAYTATLLNEEYLTPKIKYGIAIIAKRKGTQLDITPLINIKFLLALRIFELCEICNVDWDICMYVA